MRDIILFDLDGTLTNPKIGITTCVQYALNHFGIVEENPDNLLCFIGPPLKESFMQFYSMSEDDALKAVEKYRERFSVKGLYENEMFVGIRQMLQKLKESGKTIVLATAKPIEFSLKILEYFEILRYFDITVGADMHGGIHSKDDVIKRAVELAGAENTRRMIMVGDRDVDILGAIKYGVLPVGVSFGFAEENELENAGAEYIADSVEDLTEYLLNQ